MAFDPNKHLTKLKGKDYLEVKHRIVWFRDEWPHGTIHSEHVEIGEKHAIFRATVAKCDAEGNIKGTATGYGSETVKDFGDFIEKAETKAIGRALAALGYGTAFAPELDEGERIVDAPVEPRRAPQAPQQPRSAPKPANTTPDTNAPKDMRAEALGRTLHGLLEHDFLHALAVKWGFQSFADVPADNRQLALNYINQEGEPAKVQAFQRFMAQWEQENQRTARKGNAQAELLPGPDIVPNPNRFTN